MPQYVETIWIINRGHWNGSPLYAWLLINHSACVNCLSVHTIHWLGLCVKVIYESNKHIWHNETWTKWLLFCRHFQMYYFPEMKKNVIKLISKCTYNGLAFSSDKHLSEPVMTDKESWSTQQQQMFSCHWHQSICWWWVWHQSICCWWVVTRALITADNLLKFKLLYHVWS